MRKIKVVAVRGKCNAGLEIGDSFHLDGLQISPQDNQKSCCVAFATIAANASRLETQGEAIYISCPDPATGIGCNAIFEFVWEMHTLEEPFLENEHKNHASSIESIHQGGA